MPTEAEWELLARAGSDASRPFGSPRELLPRYAWMFLNSDDRTQPIARLWPTQLGLFDVIGNQWEWCFDGPPEAGKSGPPEYPEGTPDRPAADRPPVHVLSGEELDDQPGPVSFRAHRGGAYDYSPAWARFGSRDTSSAVRHQPYNGLRVVRTLGAE
jgi:formylglycine-generating enzyme required for sulfatase activity